MDYVWCRQKQKQNHQERWVVSFRVAAENQEGFPEEYKGALYSTAGNCYCLRREGDLSILFSGQMVNFLWHSFHAVAFNFK